MKVAICDVCYYQKYGQKDNQVVVAKYKISRKDAHTRFAMDVCEEHKKFLDGCKSIKECEDKYGALLVGVVLTAK